MASINRSTNNSYSVQTPGTIPVPTTTIVSTTYVPTSTHNTTDFTYTPVPKQTSVASPSTPAVLNTSVPTNTQVTDNSSLIYEINLINERIEAIKKEIQKRELDRPNLDDLSDITDNEVAIDNLKKDLEYYQNLKQEYEAELAQENVPAVTPTAPIPAGTGNAPTVTFPSPTTSAVPDPTLS